jgi:hypothetical protein
MQGTVKAIKHFEIHCGRDIETAIKCLDHEFYIRAVKYREEHIFDEDQSVRWNREEVARRNAEMKDLVSKVQAAKEESYECLYTEIYRYIMEESVYDVSFTEAEARVIWQHVNKHHDANPWDWIDEMAETMRDFIAAHEVRQ